MAFNNITICGCGVLGSQISWHIASCNFKVTSYEINETEKGKCKILHNKYAHLFNNTNPIDNIEYTTNLQKAISSASLIIESIPENLSLKEKFYKHISEYTKQDTIITTNSSTIKPSRLKNFVKHPERFLAMHFANPVWDAGIVEIMGHSTTNKEIFEKIVKFSEEICLIPIKIYKEQKGYILNSLLIPWLASAQYLYFNDIADYEDIDRVWMMSTKSPIGPFGIMDIIGLKTIYNINLMDAKKTGKRELFDRAKKMKREFIDKGRLGISSGEGFYRYPNPSYKNKK